MLLIAMLVIAVALLVAVFFVARSRKWRGRIGYGLLGLLLVGAGISGLFGRGHYRSGSDYYVTETRAGTGGGVTHVQSGSSLNLEQRFGGGIALLIGCGCLLRSCLEWKS